MTVDYVRVQAWRHRRRRAPAGQITGYGGKCVDVASATTANGTAVQL